jgi:quercetin dioxygenase-like cupin family protein
MDIKRNGTQPSIPGPADWFTGNVRIDPLFEATEQARASGASVTFEPGARTAWHTHPRGQVLIVTSGCGWTQCWGEPIVEIRATWSQALAWRHTYDGNDPYRYPGSIGRQSR